MPESADEVYARVSEAVAPATHPPMPAIGSWDVFPWQTEDGAVVPKPLPPPSVEQPREGETPDKPCSGCPGVTDLEKNVVWSNDRWRLTHSDQPSGLPLVLMLHTREHLDFPDLDDASAAEFGRLSVAVVRVVEALPHIGRVHVDRWGDGGSHFHVWFFARTKGLARILGSYAVEWDDILPPVPEEVWRADLARVSSELARVLG